MGGPRQGGRLRHKPHYQRRYRRTKRRYSQGKRQKDIDQVQDEIIKIKQGILKPEKVDPDKPGMGQFKCIICARYFINRESLVAHKRSKKHKKMLKKVMEPQYTQEEADRAGGLGREEKVHKVKVHQNGAATIRQRFRRETNVQLMTTDQ